MQVCSVSKVNISGDNALDSASKIGLAVKRLLNRFDGKVCVPSVSYLPESDLRITCTFPLPYFSIRIRLYLKKNLLIYLVYFITLLKTSSSFNINSFENHLVVEPSSLNFSILFII